MYVMYLSIRSSLDPVILWKILENIKNMSYRLFKRKNNYNPFYIKKYLYKL